MTSLQYCLKCCGVRIPPWKAAARGHNAVAQTLLATSKVDLDTKDRSRESSLLKAGGLAFQLVEDCCGRAQDGGSGAARDE